MTRTTLEGASVNVAAAGTLYMSGTTVNTPGQLKLDADTLVLGTQMTERDVKVTGKGSDVVYQKIQDKGTQDQTTYYNQFNTGSLAANANHIQAGLSAKDSIDQLAQQPGMGWVGQLQNDPKYAGKIDWKQVNEVHKQWDYGSQGLTPAGAAIVTAVAAYFSAGAAGNLGAAAGNAAGSSFAGGTVATLGEGGFIAAGGVTVSTVVSGAVTAGVTALAGEAAVAIINNQGKLAGALHDLGSSANVRNLLSAIVTGGVLGGMDLNPTGLPTAGAGSQPLFTQLGQNVQAAAARAVINTAINGGSLEHNLGDAIKGGILDTVAAQTANQIGNMSVGGDGAMFSDGATLNGFTNAVAHAIAGCAVGAVRAGNAGGCSAGAIGAAVGELAAEAYGSKADTTQFASMMSKRKENTEIQESTLTRTTLEGVKRPMTSLL